jgi:hypothetical protein
MYDKKENFHFHFRFNLTARIIVFGKMVIVGGVGGGKRGLIFKNKEPRGT